MGSTTLDIENFVWNISNETFLTFNNFSNFNISVDEDFGNFSNSSFFPLENLTCGQTSVHDKDYNNRVRIINLYITIILGILGGVMVLVWMWINRRLKKRLSSLSRVNSLILNLTLADLMVIFFAVLPQLVWEYQDKREWLAGAFLCKIVKFLQSFTLMASTNMVVIIAIDRHQAITKPLKSPMAVGIYNYIFCLLSFYLVCICGDIALKSPMAVGIIIYFLYFLFV